MLLHCPECNLQVSDKASACPHCGYPMTRNDNRNGKKKKSKRLRLPNGFGQISEIKNSNLRNPFRAMVTVGKDDRGKPICKLLKPQAFFPTYNDAYQALMEYHRNPFDFPKEMTVEELHERWYAEYLKNAKSDSARRQYDPPWRYCSPIYKLKVSELRTRHIRKCIEDSCIEINGEKHPSTSGTKVKMKSLFNLMLDYAVEYELIDKNYSRQFQLPDDVAEDIDNHKTEHIPFEKSEMDVLWKHVSDTPYVDIMLVQCYSGWRPQELGLIEIEDVNLTEKTFTGGMKTGAGKNRTVPIHSKILPLIERQYQMALRLGSKYLFNYTTGSPSSGTKLTYNRYSAVFNRIVADLNLNPRHRPHDGRIHFVTSAKAAHVDEYVIKYWVGHEINDITERVYTKRDTAWMRSEMEKIK